MLEKLKEAGKVLIGKRQSSTETSSLASSILREEMPRDDAFGSPDLVRQRYAALLRKAKSLAGSVLSQDETEGNGP